MVTRPACPTAFSGAGHAVLRQSPISRYPAPAHRCLDLPHPSRGQVSRLLLQLTCRSTSLPPLAEFHPIDNDQKSEQVHASAPADIPGCISHPKYLPHPDLCPHLPLLSPDDLLSAPPSCCPLRKTQWPCLLRKTALTRPPLWGLLHQRTSQGRPTISC